MSKGIWLAIFVYFSGFSQAHILAYTRMLCPNIFPIALLLLLLLLLSLFPHVDSSSCSPSPGVASWSATP